MRSLTVVLLLITALSANAATSFESTPGQLAVATHGNVTQRGLALPDEDDEGYVPADDEWEPVDGEDGEWQDGENGLMLSDEDVPGDASAVDLPETAQVGLDRRGRLSVAFGYASQLVKRARFSKSKAKVRRARLLSLTPQITWYGAGMLKGPACFGNSWTPNGSKAMITAPTQKRRWKKRPRCGTFVQLKRGKKVITVRVVDACATCKGAWSVGGTVRSHARRFDLSKKAFGKLLSPNTGVGKVQYRSVKAPRKKWPKSLYGPKKIGALRRATLLSSQIATHRRISAPAHSFRTMPPWTPPQCPSAFRQRRAQSSLFHLRSFLSSCLCKRHARAISLDHVSPLGRLYRFLRSA